MKSNIALRGPAGAARRPAVAARRSPRCRAAAPTVAAAVSAPLHKPHALARAGKSYAPSQIAIKPRLLGEGVFSSVFEGTLDVGGARERVVLKRVKAEVEGAQEMVEMEALMNLNAAKSARGAVAGFLGYCWVAPEAAAGQLTPGLWLVWRYEGANTLASYLRRPDCLKALAADLGVPEAAAVPAAMRQLLAALAELHAAGLVHRDIKPANVILSEAERRLKLIDLGGCADLRSGTNYAPGESIYDPLFCPPEHYVLPTNGPHIAKSLLAQATSAALWARYKPDRYDCWSAGVTLLCLALPQMRSDPGVLRFLGELEAADYDLDAWRASTRLVGRTSDFAALDADGGAGWELARELLRPREIIAGKDGSVDFVVPSEVTRISAADALKHRFLQRAPSAAGAAAAQQPPQRQATDAAFATAAAAAGGISRGGTTVRRQVGGRGLLRGLKGVLMGNSGGRPQPGVRATPGDRP